MRLSRTQRQVLSVLVAALVLGLPDEDYAYDHEYTVSAPGEDDRGPRRVVTGDEGEYYWTEDHYDSFERIVR